MTETAHARECNDASVCPWRLASLSMRKAHGRYEDRMHRGETASSMARG